MFKYKERELHGGVQRLYRFDNGYGASVIQHRGSFGHEQGLWELAVIVYEKGNKFSLVYDTDITNDVIGDLTEEEVEQYLERISKL